MQKLIRPIGGQAIVGNRYITMLGRSGWALVNSYYAAVRGRGLRPDEVVIFAEEGEEEALEKISEGIKAISEGYGFSPEVKIEWIKECNFLEAEEKISKMVKAWKEAGDRIAVDITPGKKDLVVGTILPLSKIGIDHLLYLQIDSTKDAAKPYMMIPLGRQNLRDLIEEAGGRGA